MDIYLEDYKLNSILEDYFEERTIKDKNISKKNFEFDGAGIYIMYYKKEYDNIYQKTFEAIKKNYDNIKRKAAKLIIQGAKEHNEENEDGWQAPIPSENELYKCLTINSNYKNEKFNASKTSKKYPSFINCKYNDNKGKEQDPSLVFIHLYFYGEKVPSCTFEIYYRYYPEKNKLEYDNYLIQF